MRAAVISPIVAILLVSGWDRLLRHDPVLLLILLASLVGAWLLIFFSMVLMGSLALPSLRRQRPRFKLPSAG